MLTEQAGGCGPLAWCWASALTGHKLSCHMPPFTLDGHGPCLGKCPGDTVLGEVCAKMCIRTASFAEKLYHSGIHKV